MDDNNTTGQVVSPTGEVNGDTENEVEDDINVVGQAVALKLLDCLILLMANHVVSTKSVGKA
jgi:hypothetical protein